MLKPVYTYRSIARLSEGSYSESGSKFIAYAMPAPDTARQNEALAEIKALHPMARHHCYAYRILEGNEIKEYASDAGEPSGSAGPPILGEIRRNGLLNVIIVVVRYFGGTKLGIPGLIQAYRESSAQSLQHAGIIDIRRTTRWEVQMPLALQPQFYSACKQCDAAIFNTDYGDCFTAIIDIPMERDQVILLRILGLLAGRDGEYSELLEKLGIRIAQYHESG